VVRGVIRRLWLCRPCSKQEVASRTPQIIQVVEANKEVVLMQSVAGKHMGRAFHYDKVCRLFPLFMQPLVSFQRLSVTYQHTSAEVMSTVVTSAPNLLCRFLGLSPVRKDCTLELLLP